MTGADGGESSVDDVVALAQRVEAAGLDTLWMANIFSLDAILTLAIAGRETERIELGTAVTPTYPRHPTAMAQQALTAAAACGGRFTLGIGLSHKLVIEDMLGLSFDKPAKHMREYLEVLMPALRGEPLEYDGEQYRVHGTQMTVPGVADVPVVVAALGPVMLKLAGAMTDGTNTWMVGPKTMEGHIVKQLADAASAAGRPAPRVVGGFPVLLTNRPDEARAAMAEPLAIYGQLPSYRDMLDREGIAQPQDLAIVGDEQTLRDGLARARDAGVTDFNAAIMPVEDGALERTFEFLGDWRRSEGQ